LVTIRTLEHRRVRAGAAHPAAPRRRRRLHRDVIERAGVRAADRLRAADSRHLRLYLAVAVLVTVLVSYLVLATQVTQTSYELARLQNRQAELQAEQGQLRLLEADAHTPSQVEHDAQQAGLQRQPPRGYATYQGSAINIDAPIGPAPTTNHPLWQDAVASLAGAVGGTRDVFAGAS
jgi:hypothetical protein